MNFRTTPLLVALLATSVLAHAEGAGVLRPSVEVLPGLVVTADNIATSRVPGSEGDLTFTGEVAVVDAAGTSYAAWAAFSPQSMALAVSGQADAPASKGQYMCGGFSCCVKGAYYRWAGDREVLVGYPTREQPYSNPGGRALYCSGSVVVHV